MTVFINTGNEWPEILERVAQVEKEGVNLVRLHPAMTPRQVWKKVGFPLVSKEASHQIQAIRRNPNCKSSLHWLDPTNRYRLAQRWRYLINEPYNCSDKCCDILKKQPARKFEKETGRKPILGILAQESALGTTCYLHTGNCNTFGENGGKAKSWPLAIWTENDIAEYISHNHIPIAAIYGKGATRTGCVGCGFGAYISDDDSPSLKLLHSFHPKYYEMIMNYQNNGVTYREALRKLKSIVNLKLPDE